MLILTVKTGGWVEIQTSEGAIYLKVKESRKNGVRIGFIGPKKIKINRIIDGLVEKIAQIKSVKS